MINCCRLIPNWRNFWHSRFYFYFRRLLILATEWVNELKISCLYLGHFLSATKLFRFCETDHRNVTSLPSSNSTSTALLETFSRFLSAPDWSSLIIIKMTWRNFLSLMIYVTRDTAIDDGGWGQMAFQRVQSRETHSLMNLWVF